MHVDGAEDINFLTNTNIWWRKYFY